MQLAFAPADQDFPRIRYMECRRCRETVRYEAFVIYTIEHDAVMWARYRCPKRHERGLTLTKQDYETLRTALAAPAAVQGSLL